ncbi:HNH endonuclease signature motif containing protein [Streptomyces sp. HNM0663]|uniref:HNH endonuclease signature motif containing protein n=1 Tax=Streptomyces chengmaiensis TaxID=3040919 RepID=A0ABT6HUR9_9ACTN|nr:HNH endonuclease signature motif containing protein [Streptomyces chengmaiensis]MDH2392330.1 HNH endonuclease signature motif containing protein [Streptomyces chengmaiensis]
MSSADGHWNEGPGAWRTTPRPRGWKTLRAQALERDGQQCTWVEDGQRCAQAGTDADHIGDPTDHSLSNLRTLCRYHHRKRTALQARAARGDTPPRRRPAEAHPGLITNDKPKTKHTPDDKPGF